MPADRDRLQRIWETLCWVESPARAGRVLTPPQSHVATASLCGVSVATVRRAVETGFAEGWDVWEAGDVPGDDEAGQPVIVEGDAMRVIAEQPPAEMYAPGVEIECQCARCGSHTANVDCWNCEDGYSDHDCGEDCCCCAYPEPNVPCDICRGHGCWQSCLASPEWCEAMPLPGREAVERGQIEWFTVPVIVGGDAP